MQGKTAQISAYKQILIRTHLIINKIVDGDGLIVRNIFNNQEEEVRLIGIDAPELKHCKKLNQDERETHLAAQFLIQLGRLSLNYMTSIATVGEHVTLFIELNNTTDVYGRTLAYVILSNGACLNETIIANGFAKSFNKYYCQHQAYYQQLNCTAKRNKQGLYSLSSIF